MRTNVQILLQRVGLTCVPWPLRTLHGKASYYPDPVLVLLHAIKTESKFSVSLRECLYVTQSTSVTLAQLLFIGYGISHILMYFGFYK